MLQLQMPQLQLEDIAGVLALAKTVKIDASDGLAVGQMIERVEVALAVAKFTRQAASPAAAEPAPPPAE